MAAMSLADARLAVEYDISRPSMEVLFAAADPPEPVLQLFKAVFAVLQEKHDSWLEMPKDVKMFTHRVLTFDPQQAPEQTMVVGILRPFLEQEALYPECLRFFSPVCEILCCWCRALFAACGGSIAFGSAAPEVVDAAEEAADVYHRALNPRFKPKSQPWRYVRGAPYDGRRRRGREEHREGTPREAETADGARSGSGTPQIGAEDGNERLEVAIPRPVVPIQLAVVMLSGETVLEATFSPAETILSVKGQLQVAIGVPPRHQRLHRDGAVLADSCALADVGLPEEGAWLQLEVWQIPQEEVEEARRRLAELAAQSRGALDVLSKRDFQELKGLAMPPAGIDEVLEAVMWLQAGVDPNIEVKRNGDLKDGSWKAAQRMMNNPEKFMHNLVDFPKKLGRGRVPAKNFTAVHDIRTRMGDDFSVDNMARKSCAVAGLVMWVNRILDYVEAIDRLREEFGEFDIMAELFEE